ncbi:MAG: FAD-dependent oxidoreductase, partial [Pseudomonadota bacterium]
MTIAIIGAGIAGLACAQKLSDAGVNVSVFDKGRGPGGRMSTRRAQTSQGTLRWDHGAQYFTVQDADFEAVVKTWEEAGVVSEWNGRFVSINEVGAITDAPSRPRYVGNPGMNAIIKHLGAKLDVQWERRVTRLDRDGGAWRLTFDEGVPVSGFEAIVVATPAEQVGALVSDSSPDLAREADAAVSAPCWVLMAAFDDPLATTFDGAAFEAGDLAWAARNSAKPGRAGHETWVVQASKSWSRQYLEQDADTTASA